MADLTVVTPVAVGPADRLTLGSCDARLESDPANSNSGPWLPPGGFPMAEE